MVPQDFTFIVRKSFDWFFNIVFDANFENANYILAVNYPGIDIVDFNHKVALQITSESSSGKILETARMIRERKIYKEFDTFYIYILNKKKTYRNLQERTDKITGKLFTFDAINIYDVASVYVRLNNLGDKNKIEVIREFLDIEGSKAGIHWDDTIKLYDIDQKKVSIHRNLLLKQCKAIQIADQYVYVIDENGMIHEWNPETDTILENVFPTIRLGIRKIHADASGHILVEYDNNCVLTIDEASDCLFTIWI